MLYILEGNVKRFLRGRWALTTVVTALIILVIAVLLASAVSYFAINVSSTRVQEESVQFSKQHIWYYPAADFSSEAVILITNTGGRDIVIQKVTLRGQTVNWSTTYYVRGTFALTDAPFIDDITQGTPTIVPDGNGSYKPLIHATGDVPLSSGESMLVYVKNPDSITVGDVGLTVAINVYTMQAIYYKEANVEVPIHDGQS
jgi:hypothetical protein